MASLESIKAVLGPLLIITVGMHGNEPAGVRALELLFKMLEVEPITNHHSHIRRLLVSLAILLLLIKKVRYIDQDINRLWTKKNTMDKITTMCC